MKSLHIIMPMAGEGSRFLKEGWSTPKPLIKLKGIPLFMRAINSVAKENIPLKYSFIVRQEHIEKYNIDKYIKNNIPEATIFSVTKTTRGAVETCLVAEQAICPSDAIMVMDCDLEFHSETLIKNIHEILTNPQNNIKGGLLVSFTSNLSKYSYAEIDENNIVRRTAEKEVISNHALCGAYFFSSAKMFLEAAHQLLNDSSFNKPEFYISLLYNYLLKDGNIVKLCPMEMYHSYGTPEELKNYL